MANRINPKLSRFFSAFALIISLCLPVSAKAASPDLAAISLSHESVKPGEEIKMEAVYTNNFPITFKGKLEVYIIDVQRQSPGIASEEKIEVPSGRKSQAVLLSKKIEKNDPQGLWVAVMEVKNRQGILTARTEKTFFVTDTDKIINARVETCSDPQCLDMKAVFLSSGKIHAKLNANLEGFSVKSALLDSQGEILHKIEFPNGLGELPILAPGAYVIKADLDKNGYSPLTIQKDFSVISQPLNSTESSACHLDGICHDGENPQNCPDDCPAPRGLDRNISYATLLISLFTILSLALFVMRRHARANHEQGQNQNNQT